MSTKEHAGQTPDSPARHAAGSAKNLLTEFDTFQKILTALGAAGLLYVLGGIATMMRLMQTNLPVERSLSVIPRDDMLVLGIREFGAIVLLTSISYALAAWRLTAYAAAVVTLAALAPWTISGGLWIAALLGIGITRWLARRSNARTRAAWLPLIAFGLIGCAVVGRYLDPPYRFEKVAAYVKDVAPTNGCPETDAAGLKPSYCGVFLGATSDNALIARPDSRETRSIDESEVVILPRSNVSKILLFAAPSTPPPRASLFGRLTGSWMDEVSCDPLECWIGNGTYGQALFG